MQSVEARRSRVLRARVAHRAAPHKDRLPVRGRGWFLRLGDAAPAQQHRHGETDQRAESPLGRLTLRHKLGREYFDSGCSYGCTVRHYYVAKGIQTDLREGHTGTGLGVRFGTARRLAEELERIEPPLQRLSPVGFSALKTLCVHEREVHPSVELEAVGVLVELGQLLRMARRR